MATSVATSVATSAASVKQLKQLAPEAQWNRGKRVGENSVNLCKNKSPPAPEFRSDDSSRILARSSQLLAEVGTKRRSRPFGCQLGLAVNLRIGEAGVEGFPFKELGGGGWGSERW